MGVINDMNTRIWYGENMEHSYSIPYISWLSHAQLNVRLAFVIIDATPTDVVEDVTC